MTKHSESQRRAEALMVGDEIATPGVHGVVLAKGRVRRASKDTYAVVVLLTTVQGNDYAPFRIANWYWQDDATRQGWQSYSGRGYRDLFEATEAATFAILRPKEAR